MIVSPGFRIPSFSASSIILTPILSLTDPPGLKYSHLATDKRREDHINIECTAILIIIIIIIIQGQNSLRGPMTVPYNNVHYIK